MGFTRKPIYPSTLNPQPSTLNPQPQTLNHPIDSRLWLSTQVICSGLPFFIALKPAVE